MPKFLLILLIALGSPLFVVAEDSVASDPSKFEIRNYSDLRPIAGFDKIRFTENKLGRKLRVVVIDNNFDGYDKAGSTLSPHRGLYDLSVNKASQSSHGLTMAQIFWAFVSDTGYRRVDDVELFLITASGYTDFVKAIDTVIDLKADIVLHSIVRDYGGNFDGAGFFNAQVNRAVAAGTLWFNAAGNFAKSTYNVRSIQTGADDWVKMPGPNSSLPIRCKPQAPVTTCNTRIVLSWNDFSDDVNARTDKDLDLVLTDDLLNIVQVSALVQSVDEDTQGARENSISNGEIQSSEDGRLTRPKPAVSTGPQVVAGEPAPPVIEPAPQAAPAPAAASSSAPTIEPYVAPAAGPAAPAPGPGFSQYPREIIEAQLKPGRYFIRVKNRSQNFTAQDMFRIAVDDIFTELEFSDRNENLMIMADNPNVITVGASDSARSSKSLRLGKPDLLFPSIVELSDKEQYAGSSNAAAIAAAKSALLLLRDGPVDRATMMQKLR